MNESILDVFFGVAKWSNWLVKLAQFDVHLQKPYFGHVNNLLTDI
jgi:hypothetical protein